MAVFVAAADESSNGKRDGTFIYGGLVAPESDWRDHFSPAWQERVLNGRPSIPYLHMVDIRGSTWRKEKGLSDIEADRRIDEAFRVVQSMGSLYLVTSRLDEKVFRDVFSRFKIQAPKKRSFPVEPDFICFIAFATVALTYVARNFPETEKVDFVVEQNGKMTSRIKEFYSVMGECFLDPSLEKFLGDLIPGGKDRIPLQAADVVCWHDRRREAGLLSPLDAARYRILSRMQGFRHEWTNEELTNRLSGFRSSFLKPGP